MQQGTIYTIGHSNQGVETFIGLLKRHSIEVVVDVRSSPYSKYASQFNKKDIQREILTNDIKYLFMGREIGGKPDETHFYDSGGYVLYSEIVKSPMFIEGIERLLQGIKQYQVALMCSEESPVTCHRHLLIGRVLSDYGVDVMHIRSDGHIQTEEEILMENRSSEKDNAQQSLFETDDRDEWKSTRPVLKKADAV